MNNFEDTQPLPRKKVVLTYWGGEKVWPDHQSSTRDWMRRKVFRTRSAWDYAARAALAIDALAIDYALTQSAD